MKRPDARFQRDGRIGRLALVAFVLLLVPPGYALSRLAGRIDWRILGGAPVAMSALTYFLYRSDKLRATAAEWRIPESTLHFCEMLGGWPGAFLAQRKFRHKISKISYQFIFWAIVSLHQFVALDFLIDWKLTNALLALLRSKTG